MSKPLIPYDRWLSGTNENSIPANDNSLRDEIFNSSAIASDVTAQPAFTSPDDDGKWYVIPAGATGAQWATFAEDSAAIFYGGTWYEFTAVSNSVVVIDGSLYRYDSGWVPVAGGGGGSAAPVVTESSTSLGADGSNAGNYTRFTNSSAKAYTFDGAETYTVGAEYHGRNVGAGSLTLTEAGGMTLNPPADGTLVVPQGGTFTVKIVAADEADVIGVTVAA